MSCTKPPYAPFPEVCPYAPDILPTCAVSQCDFQKETVDEYLKANQPTISVIIPYIEDNVWTLDKCLRSVINQSYTNIEIIIVDDTDNYGKVKPNPSEGLLNITNSLLNGRDYKVINLGGNYGQSYARNKGVSWSVGNFIAFIDADDEWSEEHLMMSIKVLVEESAGMVYSDFYYKYYNKNLFCAGIQEYNYKKLVYQNLDEILKRDNPISINSVVLRKKAFIVAGGFEEGVVCGEDGVLWRRISEAGFKIAYKSVPTSFYCKYDLPTMHQSSLLRMPKEIKGKHLIGNGTNGQELDDQETYIKRVEKLMGKERKIKYVE